MRDMVVPSERVDGFDKAGKLVLVARHNTPARMKNAREELARRRIASLTIIASRMDIVDRARIVPASGGAIDVPHDELLVYAAAGAANGEG